MMRGFRDGNCNGEKIHRFCNEIYDEEEEEEVVIRDHIDIYIWI